MLFYPANDLWKLKLLCVYDWASHINSTSQPQFYFFHFQPTILSVSALLRHPDYPLDRWDMSCARHHCPAVRVCLTIECPRSRLVAPLFMKPLWRYLWSCPLEAFTLCPEQFAARKALQYLNSFDNRFSVSSCPGESHRCWQQQIIYSHNSVAL